MYPNYFAWLLTPLCFPLKWTCHSFHSTHQSHISSQYERGTVCSLKANSVNTALLCLQPPPPHPGVTACPEPKLQLWAVSFLHKPSQVSGAWSRRLPQHNEKQLSAPCRTTPAVHKQSFVSPPLDSISFYLPPSAQICSKGRWYLSRKEMYSGSNLLLRLNSLTPRIVCRRN